VIESYFRDRRERVSRLLGDDSALIVAASPEIAVGDAELRYVIDPDLFWLTGYTEPEAVAVICPSHADSPFTLFVRPRDPGREVWTGTRGGTDAAVEAFGADAAYPIEALAE
jgi:Xaa-Pro aminopeptidase